MQFFSQNSKGPKEGMFVPGLNLRHFVRPPWPTWCVYVCDDSVALVFLDFYVTWRGDTPVLVWNVFGTSDISFRAQDARTVLFVHLTRDANSIPPFPSRCQTVKVFSHEKRSARCTQRWTEWRTLFTAGISVSGCTFVIHTASPRPAENPEDEKEVIRPAVDGTRHVLKVIDCDRPNEGWPVDYFYFLIANFFAEMPWWGGGGCTSWPLGSDIGFWFWCHPWETFWIYSENQALQRQELTYIRLVAFFCWLSHGEKR